MNLIDTNSCTFCGTHEETLLHLFYNCEYITPLINKITTIHLYTTDRQTDKQTDKQPASRTDKQPASKPDRLTVENFGYVLQHLSRWALKGICLVNGSLTC